MAHPKSDACDIDEAEKSLGRLLVTGGDASSVLQLVEATLDQTAQAV